MWMIKNKIVWFAFCIVAVVYAEETIQELPIPDSLMISSLNVKDTEIRDLLQGLAVQYDLNLFLDPEVQGLVTVNFNKQKLKDALQLLLTRNGYIYSVEHGVISVRKPLPKAPPPPKPKEFRFEVNWEKNLLSVDVEKAPLEKLIRRIVEKTNRNVVIESGLEVEVTVFFKSLTFEQSMKLIADGQGLELREDMGLYTLSKHSWDFGGEKGDDARGSMGGKFRVKLYKDSLLMVEALDAPLALLIGEIFAQAKMNTVVYGKLEGQATARMDSVSIRDALKFLFKGTSYTFWEYNGVYFIGPHEMQTADNSLLIRLKHLRAEDVINLLPSNLTKSIQIQVVKSQNALIATGTYDVLDAISQYVEKIDLHVPQILIEVLVVDIDMQKGRSYGLDLLLGNASNVQSSETIFPAIESVFNRNQSQNIVNKVGLGDVISLPKNFIAKVHALEQEKILNVKARSQIATLNGETAVLTIGQTQYYMLTSEIDYNQGDALTAKTTQRFEKVEANSNIVVTPYVTGEGEITCEIVPDFSEPEKSFNSDEMPTLNKRYIKSSVRLRNGETIVLGGMVKESEADVHKQLPFLGSIPVIGWLFRNVEHVISRSQLLIFVTPSIYYGSEGSVDVEKELKRSVK